MSAFLIGGTQIILGPSTVTKMSAGSFENGFILKQLSPSYTVELTMGESFGVGSGYPLITDGVLEIVEVSGPAQFFLAVAGETATVSIARAYSSGATGLPTLPVSPPLGML
jgi:hypothetical protein